MRQWPRSAGRHRRAQAPLRRPRRGDRPHRAGGRRGRAPVPPWAAGDGEVGADPRVRDDGTGAFLRIPADAILRAQRGFRPDRPGPAPRGNGCHGHHRHAPRGRVRLPRRAVQRQQCDPEQSADGAERARLSPRCRGPPASAALAFRGVERTARGRVAPRPVRSVLAALPHREPEPRGDAPAPVGRLGARESRAGGGAGLGGRSAQRCRGRSITSIWRR